jgi:hypothetical protein
MVAALHRHSGILVAVLTVIAAGLGVLSAALGLKAADVTHQRNAVQGRAATLETRQTDLQTENQQLQADNADLRARLRGGSGSGSAATQTDVEHRNLTVPLPTNGETEQIRLDRGEVNSDCCTGDLSYSRNDATDIPELNSDVAFSIDVSSGAVTEAQCSQAVSTSPTNPLLRRFREGMLICATTQGGTSLLRLASPPTQTGTLRFVQTFWPN